MGRACGWLAILVGALSTHLSLANEAPSQHVRSGHKIGWENGQPTLPSYIIHKSSKFDAVHPRQWPQLLKKMQTPGSTINVVSLGGSVSVGRIKDSTTSWVLELMAWLRASFPNVTFNLVELAKRATAATFAALCLVQDIPANADLVIIEYAVNGFSRMCQCTYSHQPAGFETLVRMSVHAAPQAALLHFAAYMFNDSGVINRYQNTGEDQMTTLSKYYDVPMLSVRDAFWESAYRQDSPLRLNLYSGDNALLVDQVHPSDYGAKLFAALVGGWVQQQLQKPEVDDGFNPPPGHLPPAINRASQQEHLEHWCIQGEKLEKHVTEQQGWEWVDDGDKKDCAVCKKLGWASDKPGAHITFSVNSDIGRPDPAVLPLLVVSAIQSYYDMGRVRLECVGGCACNATTIEGFRPSRRTTEAATVRFDVTPHRECLVRMTLQAGATPEAGKPRFKLTSLAVCANDDILSHAYAPAYQ